MPSLGVLWVVGSVAFSALCGVGVALCREIMLEEVQRQLPEGQKIKHPHLNYRYFEIVNQHARFFPQSRIRAVSKFLVWMACLTMGSLMIITLGIVILRGARQP